MEQSENNQSLESLLEQDVQTIKTILAYGLSMNESDIKVSFPSLKNFYEVNGIFKSSWAIYTHEGKLPNLLYTGNYIIQGPNYTKRSKRSPFGASALSPLTSVASTFSKDASLFKQNWTHDISLVGEEEGKLNLTLQEYQELLRLINKVRAKWTLHLSEEGNFDFVISEFSEPNESPFFVGLDGLDSAATRIKTYFKPTNEDALSLIKTLAAGTEFEGKFYNIQPGTWVKDDVLIEMEKLFSDKFYNGEQPDLTQENEDDVGVSNPFIVFKTT